MIGQIFLILSLLILSGFFSSSETAFTSLSSFQIDSIAEKRGSRGKLVRKLLKNLKNFLQQSLPAIIL